MVQYVSRKALEIEAWLENYNIEIQSIKNAQSEAINIDENINFRLRVISSFLLGVNMLDSRYAGIENILTTDNQLIKDLRDCPDENLQKIKELLDREDFKAIGSSISANYILENFQMEKDNGNLEYSEYNRAVDYNNYQSQGIEYPYEKSSHEYQNPERNNYNSQKESINYEGNYYKATQDTRQQYDMGKVSKNSVNYNSNKPISKEDILTQGLCQNIDGLFTVIEPLENGTYSFKFELTLDTNNVSQWVNEQIKSREDIIKFIEENEEEIFGLEHSYENTNEIDFNDFYR